MESTFRDPVLIRNNTLNACPWMSFLLSNQATDTEADMQQMRSANGFTLLSNSNDEDEPRHFFIGSNSNYYRKVSVIAVESHYAFRETSQCIRFVFAVEVILTHTQVIVSRG